MSQRQAQRPGLLNPTQRVTVRLLLATGATIATLMGAQALALAEWPGQNTDALAPAINANIQSDNVVPVQNVRRRQQSFVNPAPFQPRPFSRSSRGG